MGPKVILFKVFCPTRPPLLEATSSKAKETPHFMSMKLMQSEGVMQLKKGHGRLACCGPRADKHQCYLSTACLLHSAVATGTLQLSTSQPEFPAVETRLAVVRATSICTLFVNLSGGCQKAERSLPAEALPCFLAAKRLLWDSCGILAICWRMSNTPWWKKRGVSVEYVACLSRSSVSPIQVSLLVITKLHATNACQAT